MNHFLLRGVFRFPLSTETRGTSGKSPHLFSVANKQKVKFLSLFFTAFFLGALLISCPSPTDTIPKEEDTTPKEKDPPPKEKDPPPKDENYLLTVTPPSSGNITITVDGIPQTSPVTIKSGGEARLEFIPLSGDYYLGSWTGDGSGDDNPLIIIMDKDKTIAARVEESIFVEEPKEYTLGDITYTLDGGTAAIKSYDTDSTETSLTLEDTVTTEGTSYTITAVKAGAFKDAVNLASITIPASVLSLEDEAFSGSLSLAQVEFLGEDTALGRDVFENTQLLSLPFRPLRGALEEGAVVPAGIYSGSGDHPDNSFVYRLYRVGENNQAYLKAYQGLEQEVVIPGTITHEEVDYSVNSIGENSFTGVNLEKITIPDSVVSIENRAFTGTQLGSVIIPASVTIIGDSAFQNNNSLLSIEFKGSSTVLGRNVFLYTPIDNLGIFVEGAEPTADTYSIEFYSPVGANSDMKFFLYQQENKFYAELKEFDTSSARTTVTIPGQVTKNSTNYTVIGIGAKTFYQSTVLTSVTIPNSVTFIGDYAFFQNTALTRITIPASVTSIGDSAFTNTSINEVLFDQNSQLTTIGDSAFSANTSLSRIILPDSLTSIGDSAFDWNTALIEITIPASVKSLGDSTFANSFYFNKITFNGSGTVLGTDVFLNTPLAQNSRLVAGSSPAAGVYEGNSYPIPGGS